MKLHLPTTLRAALMATFTAILTLGSATTAATYSNLTEVSIDADNHVYYDGKGTFYVQSAQVSSLDVTIDLNQFVSYQGSNDYTGFTPFVGWTFANGITDGIADVSTKNNASTYTGLTGYYGSNKYALSGNGQSSLTLATLQSYATNNMVTVTVQNNLTGGVSLTLGSGSNAVTYQNTSLKFSGQNTSTSSYSVNLNYVTSVTLKTASTLDTDAFELPPDYSQPFHSDRWDAGDKTSLGRVLFVGDSITHGVGEQTWRWQLFKTMVDNGIENEIAGPRSDYDTRFANTTSDRGMTSYGGEEFNNVHLAQSSGRTHNIITGSANGSGVNYGGWSTSKTAASYNADTILCMMGTNDILSDAGALIPKFAKLLGGTVSYDEATKHYTWEHNDTNSWGEWGTMGTIAQDLMKQEGDTMYVMSIPTWAVRNDLKYGPNGNVDVESAHHGVQEYNVMLKQWTESYSASTGAKVKYVDINRGLVDLTDSVSFKGYTKFFREGSDQLHPTEQGSLIIAGNLAQGMGLAGRTAGLVRSQVGHEDHGWLTAAQSINLAAGQTQQVIADKFTIEGGYTIDFSAVFGDGSANGWKGLDSALSVAIGDGTNGGTLKLSEGYIAWDDTVLFCQDNHLTDNDSLRVAYHEGNAEQNIGSGYYVWLGDMLIGQALSSGTNTANGVTLTSTGGSAVITGLSYANTAYAPSTTFITALDNGVSHVTPPSQPEEILPPMPSHNGEATHFAGVDFTNAGTATGPFGTNNQPATGDITVIRTGGATANYIGAVGAVHDGNVTVKYNAVTTSASVMLATNKDVSNGNITTVLDGETNINKVNHFNNSGDYSFFGAFSANVGGALQLEVNNATLSGGIQMGVINGDGTISGGTKLIVNEGASVGGDIFGGGSANGTTDNGVINNGTSITINGGTVSGNIYGGNRSGGTINGGTSVTITGGTITGSVNGGSLNNAGTINGGTSVTVEGNKASIGGNITADKVTLKDVETSGYSDGFDQYKGTITASNLELNNYTAEEVNAKLVGEHLVAKGETVTTVSNLTLTACDITVEGGATLILSGTQTYGHTATYSGALTIAEGTTFTVTNPTEGTRPGQYTSGDNGFEYSGHIYDVLTPETPAVDHLLGTDGKELGLVTNLTLKGGEGMENYFFVYKTDTGILSAYENIETSTCYITKGSLTYGKQTGAYGATESLKLSSGATLVMADNLAEGVTINSADGTVDLLENVTLSQSDFADGSTATLTGTGTFSLGTVTAAGDLAMPTGLTLDSDEWKGSVLVTTDGKQVRNMTADSLNALAPNTDAWVELRKVKGFFSAADQTINANLRLMGEKALFIDDGYGSTYTFTGDIAGDGVFAHSYDGNSYKFQGDISEWVGAFETTTSSQYKRATGVTLEGKATTINAALTSNPGSNLALTLGNITDGATGYTFNNIVKVHDLSADGQTMILGSADDVVPGGHLTVMHDASIGKLALSENTSATFESGATLGALEGATGSTLSFGGTLTVTGALSLPQLTLAEGTTAVIGGQASMNKLVAAAGSAVHFGGKSVRLSQDSAYTASNVEASKATLNFADGANVRVSGRMDIGTLHADGAVSVGDNRNVNYVQSALIHNLSSEKEAHLTLAAVFDTKLDTTYTLGATDTDAQANHFDGVIEFKRNNAGNGVTQLIIADTNIAADAVIELNNANEGKKFGVGIAADLVKVEGIRDAEGSKGGLIFSGSNYNSPESKERTIEITGNENYHTSANLGANLNVTKSGRGTQTFGGDMSAFTGTTTVTEGAVEIAHTSALGNGSLSLENGTLTVAENLENISVSAAAGKTFTGSIRVADGSSLSLMNLTSASKVEIENLSLGTEATLGGYNASTTLGTEEASLLVTGVLSAAEDSVLKANLVLGLAATLDFTGANGLQMGSTVTLQSGSHITLSETMRDTLSGMVRGEELVLFRGVDGFTIGGEGYDETVRYAAVDFFDLGTHPYADHFVVNYDASADGGRVSLYLATPEPATATLSLLALAALAARRRRH